MAYWLTDTAKKHPNRVAVLGEKFSITYAELLVMVESTTQCLIEITRAQNNQKIAILLENRIEYILLIHSFGAIDSFPVLINTRLTRDETMWQLSKLKVEKIIVSRETFEKVMDPFIRLDIYSVDESVPGTTFLSLNKGGKSIETNTFSLQNIQSLVFTSGTTGKPKVATIRYRNLHASALGSASRLGVYNNDVWLLTIPLYHIGGLSILFRSCINGTTIFLDKKFKTERLVELINKYQVTVISLVPTMLQWLISHQAFSKPTPTLRLILLGGERTGVELVEASKRLNLPIATSYGMTETVSQIATSVKTQVFTKPLSVGKPLNGIKVTIINEQNSICDANEVGEIIVSGDVVIDGYYDESSLNFGTYGFRTGDIGYLDHDGDLHILQRRVDLIISGGENIYPSEIEDVMIKIRGIKSVCVIGIDNTEWGQIPVAAVVLDSNFPVEKEEILNFCKQSLASFKIPKLVLFVEDFPLNSLGKIDRKMLGDLFYKADASTFQ